MIGTDYLGIHCGDSRDLSFVPDGTVDLVVTSPPYNAGIGYDVHNDRMDWNEYFSMTDEVWQECYRALKPGGRIAVNIAGLDRQPYRPLQHDTTRQLSQLGFLHRVEIIWEKGSVQGGSTAWGSWMSASNPILRDNHEYVEVFSKERFGKGYKGESDITRDEFLEWTISTWTIRSASARKAGHPAPFPLELATRLIKLYSYKGDVVLDPFMGSGTTCVAAKALDRKWIGVDISPHYCELAEKNVNPPEPRQVTFGI